MNRRIDDTGFGEVRILQNPDAFCYGVDAVLLAGFVSECIRKRRTKNFRLCDLGTGTGIIPLILSHKTEVGDLWGVEYQEASYQLACENIVLNHLENRLHFLRANVCDLTREGLLQHNIGEPGSFDIVTSNPPYTPAEKGLVCERTEKYIARHEAVGSLEDFLRTAALLLKDRGELFLVHRPSRMVDILTTCRKWRLEPKRLQLVSGHRGETPNLLLLQAVKHGGVELRVEPQIYVREENGDYSQALKEIYERN